MLEEGDRGRGNFDGRGAACTFGKKFRKGEESPIRRRNTLLTGMEFGLKEKKTLACAGEKKGTTSLGAGNRKARAQGAFLTVFQRDREREMGGKRSLPRGQVEWGASRVATRAEKPKELQILGETPKVSRKIHRSLELLERVYKKGFKRGRASIAQAS